MRTNIFKTAVALSDSDLLARTQAFAADEREATAELVAHLAVLEKRRSAYAALGYGSLYAYCTGALRLSEDAACNRIAASRWCGQFPVIADLMAAGTVSLTAVRLVGPHLTNENHEAVLAKAANKAKAEIQELVAALAPQPDAPALVRALPAPRAADAAGAPTAPEDSAGGSTLWASTAAGGPGLAAPQLPRPVVKPTAPDRYRVQCTIGREAYDELRRLQALLRREIPGGDPGLIFERALHLLLERVEKAKLGKGVTRASKAIRSGTDDFPGDEKRQPVGKDGTPTGGTLPARSRRVPAAVRATVWERDGAQCAFVSGTGQRCTERTFLEFHHLLPYARHGPATVANIALRCRRHNQYEGELDFGPRSSEDGASGPVR